MSDETAARVLEAAIKCLRTEVKPRVSDDAASIRIDHITRMLRLVAARVDGRENALQAFLSEGGAPISDEMASGDRIERLEKAFLKSEDAFSARIPSLLDGAKGAAGVAELETLVAREKRFYISQDPDIASGAQVVYRGGRILEEAADLTEGPPPVTEESLTRYLQMRSGSSSVRVENVRVIPGGFSKITIMFRRVDERGASDLVMRKDMPVPFIDKTVVNEYSALKSLYESGFPVARPLWLETDKSAFGGAFLVSERVAGTSDVAQWSKDAARGRAACDNLARAAAALHSRRPEDCGYAAADAALSAGEQMERELERWARLFRSRRVAPTPLQELPLTWLIRNIPRALYERPSRIIHGDLGFHNIMVGEDGAITALLDWEFSTLGDPTQDLMFVRAFVESLMNWDDWLALYRNYGGVEPCVEASFFFDLWSRVRNGIGCVDAQRLFDTLMPDEVKFALAGHVFGPYMYLDQCETLLRHLKGEH